MIRIAVAALAGIALITAGSMWFIVAMDRRGPVATTELKTTQAPDPPAAAASPHHPDPPPPEPAPAAPARRDAPPTWDLPRDPAQRLRALQPLQHEVEVELERLELRSGCDLRDVDVALTLETRDREVRIVEAAPRRRAAEPGPEASSGPAEGEVDEAIARCVRERIRGATLWTPSARAGRRWTTFYASPPRPR